MSALSWTATIGLQIILNDAARARQAPCSESTPSDEQKLQQLDSFARLMQQPDEHFAQLQAIWDSNREFRLLRGPLT
jgi:hypothetical protein